MRPWLAVPGFPGGGHITPAGYWWHPGPIDGCPKCPDPDNAPSASRGRRGNGAPDAQNGPEKGRRA